MPDKSTKSDRNPALKKSENKLSEHNRFKELIEETNDWIWEVDRDGYYTYSSPRVFELLGYTPEEIIGKTPFDLMPVEEAWKLSETYKRFVSVRESFSGLENVCVHKNGSLVVMETNGRPIINSDGAFDGYRGVDRDITDRRMIERQVVHERDRAKNYLDIAGVIIVVLDFKGKIQLINRKGCRLLGKTEEQLIGKSWFKHVVPKDIQREVSIVHKEIMAGRLGLSEYYENPITSADGGERLIAWHNKLLTDPDGNAVGTLSSGVDITDQRKAEIALEETKSLFQSVIDQTPVGILIADAPDVKIRMANPAALGIRGSAAQELTDISVELHPEKWQTYYADGTLYRPEDLPLSRAVLHGETLHNVEVMIKRSDGDERWVLANSFPVKNIDGDIIAGAVVFPDITERRQFMEAVEVSEARFRTIFNTSPTLMTLFDLKERKRLLINDTHSRVTGYSKEEMEGRSFEDLFLFTDKERYQAGMKKFEEDGKINNFEIDLRAKDGSIVNLSYSGVILNMAGRLVALVSAVDITEQKNKEAELQIALNEIQKLKEITDAENVILREEIRYSSLHGGIIAQSDQMKNVLRDVEQVAPLDTTVLLQGETGTGKEILARLIHSISQQKSKSLITVNCAAIPATLIESELFGRERGAYTGAVTRQIGRFEVADQSTIFLDEIGELPFELQSKLLRFIQEGRFERLGSTISRQVNCRIIAATNRNLSDEVAGGRFREDLFYRLNVFPILIPPLRERIDDIAPLIWSFINEFSDRMGKRIDRIPERSMDQLRSYPWPGNIRELRNVIERAMINSSGRTLRVHVPTDNIQKDESLQSLESINRNHILKVLETTHWRIRGKNGAADILQINPTTLESRLKKLNIVRPDGISHIR